MDWKEKLRVVRDFPKPGIGFIDITTLLADPAAFDAAVEAMIEPLRSRGVDKVVCIESRGFIFGAPAALRLGAGMVLLRKPGKLPAEKIREEYALEYGVDAIEMHADAVRPGERVAVVDDLLATGGTAEAATRLIEKAGGEVAGCGFMIGFTFLNAAEKLDKYDVFWLMQYDSEEET